MKNLDGLTLEQLKELKEAVNKKIKAEEEKQKEQDKQKNQEKQTLSDEEIIQRIEDISESIDEEAGLVVLYKGKNRFFNGMRGRESNLSQAVVLNCLHYVDLCEILTKSISTVIIATLRDRDKYKYH